MSIRGGSAISNLIKSQTAEIRLLEKFNKELIEENTNLKIEISVLKNRIVELEMER